MQVYNNNTAETPQGRVQPANQVCNSSCVAQSALETARDFFLIIFKPQVYWTLHSTMHYIT